MERYLIAPQMWSLSVELIFYAMAPLLMLVRTRWLIALTLGSFFLLRPVGTGLAWQNLLFTYSFWLFLLGILGHRSLILRLRTPVHLVLASFPFIYFFIGVPSIVPLSDNLTFAWWLGFAIGVPSLFQLTKSCKFDRSIGELSYPIYVCHTMFIYPAVAFGELSAIAAFISTAALSWILLRLIQEPIDKYRQRRIEEMNRRVGWPHETLATPAREGAAG
jgi:peptidoglycan/LPS O-acetylase OafA/YrhL